MHSSFFDLPRRVAVAGDWHGDAQWAVKMIHVAAEQGATHLVHLGDFGYRFSVSFLDALQRALDECGIILGFVDGNHEDFSWLNAQAFAADGTRHLRERIIHLPRGLRWTWGDLSLLALGGAHSVDRQSRVPGASWWPEETITLRQAHEVTTGGHADVMFTHDVPAGVPVEGLAPPGTFPAAEIRTADQHRELLRQVTDVVRPSALWHGHYHARYDAWLHGADYRTRVRGMSRDNDSTRANMMVVSVADLAAESLSEG